MAGFPTRSEPPNLLRADGKRPDGVTLIPYSRGKPLVWDATVRTTVCASLVGQTSRQAGAAAETADAAKRRKYAAFAPDYMVVPLAFETHGAMSAATGTFLEALGKQIVRESGCRRAATFFYQRLSLAIQRGNAVSILGSMEPVEEALDAERGGGVCAC